MKMRVIVDQDVRSEWVAKLSFRPYWLEDDNTGEWMHLETGGAPGYPGTGSFELRSTVKFGINDVVLLHKVYVIYLERFFTTNHWLVDPETGGHFLYERCTFVPFLDVDEQTLHQWYKRAFHQGQFALGDGTFIRAQSEYLYRAFSLPRPEQPEWCLDRVFEGWYTPLGGNKTRVHANLPERHIKLETLWTDTRHPYSTWCVSYVLCPYNLYNSCS